MESISLFFLWALAKNSILHYLFQIQTYTWVLTKKYEKFHDSYKLSFPQKIA